MKAHSANMINSITLIVIGLWDYLAIQELVSTNMIPVSAGILLLLFYDGVKREDKIVAHIAVVITLLVFLSLIKPFADAIQRGKTEILIRNLIMIITELLAMVYFVKSFIDARKGPKLSTRKSFKA